VAAQVEYDDSGNKMKGSYFEFEKGGNLQKHCRSIAEA
jgi:hypothetical protein